MVSQNRDASLEAAVLQHGTTSRRQTTTTRQEKKPSAATGCAPTEETEGNATWTCRRSGKSVKRCALLAGSLDTGTLSFRWNRLPISKGKTRKFDAFYSSPRRVGLLWDWRGPARDGAGRDPCSLHFCISSSLAHCETSSFSLHKHFSHD